MLSNLPAWASSGAARALIARVVAEKPDYHLSRGAWIEGGNRRRYRGSAASQLRAIHSAYLEEQLAIADARWAEGVPNDVAYAEFNAAAADDASPDELIERLLEMPALECAA